MLALSIGMGLLLAFTRRNPYLTRSPYVVKWSGESLTRMNFVLAAGGTGGHMIPAHALAAELKSARPWRAADHRRARRALPRPVQGRAGAHPARGPARRRPDRLAQGADAIVRGRAEAKSIYREHRPDAVIGFGGYPAFPALLAASAMHIPTVLHEQNAVLGRVNRLLAGDAAAIGTAYDKVERLKAAHREQESCWSAIRCARSHAARRTALPAVRRSRAAQDPGHRRKPGRERARRAWCPKASACSSRRFAAASRSSSNAGPTTSSGCATVMPTSASRPS